MTPDEDHRTIIAELDAAHAEANSAYARRDIAAYRGLFSEDLQYTQLDGQTIGLDRLTADVRNQFSRACACGSTYERESIEIEAPGIVTETLTQSAWVEMAVFGVFKRGLQVRRRGRYTWRKTGDGLRIVKVQVLAETVA